MPKLDLIRVSNNKKILMTISLKVLVQSKVIKKLKIIEVKTIRDLIVPKN
jgi:hypothetical protein